MNRSNNTAGVTLVSLVVILLAGGIAWSVHEDATKAYTDSSLPTWEATCQEVREGNYFWKATAGTSRGGAMDRAFVDDVYTTHLAPNPDASELLAAREHLMNAEAEYNVTMLERLGFVDPIVTSTPSALQPTSEFLAQLSLFKEQGLDAVVQPLPPAPVKPDYWAMIGFRWLAAFPHWLVAWGILSGLFYAIYAACAKSFKEVYGGVVHESGEWFARLVMFLEMAPLLIVLGAGELAIKGTKVASRAVGAASKEAVETLGEVRHDLKHPNRKQIRHARRLLKRLERLGASGEAIDQARKVLSGWQEVPQTPAMQQTRTDPRQRRIEEAQDQVARLGAELLCERDPVAALSEGENEAMRTATDSASRPAAAQRTRAT